MNRTAIGAVGWVLSLVAPHVAAVAQAPVTRSVEIVVSKKLNQVRTVFIATPEDYLGSNARYPVLVLLDANDFPQYELAVANVRFLASRNAIPELIVVGIPNAGNRTHDLTPVATGSAARDFPTAGGSAAFTAFITDEVLPMIRTKYRVLPGTILAGHSFGGLLALDIAARSPGAFNGIIAMSPSLWWNDASLVVTYADAIARSRGGERIFITSGGLEPDIDRTTRSFVKRLDSLKPRTVAWTYHAYPEDTHGLTPAPSLADGLRFVFEPVSVAKLPIAKLAPDVDSATVVRAVLETEEVYPRAARRLGLPDRLPEMVLNELGYNVLVTLKNPNLAAWVFEQNVNLYPDSPNVYDSFGDALLAKGDTTEARIQFQRAADAAFRLGVPIAVGTRQKIGDLDKASALKRQMSSEPWQTVAPMIHARSAHAVVSTDDGIYVIGGTGEAGAPVHSIERFDGREWRDESTLPGDGLNAPAAAVIGTRIYVIGGFKTVTNVPSSDVLVYDTETRSWSSAAPLPAPRGGHAAVVLDGRIHVIGGGNSRSTLADHSEYDPATNTWTERAPLSRSKGSPAAVAFDGKLYSIGGRSGPGDFGDVEIYDPAQDRWSPGPAIEPRGTAGAAAYCGTIYVFGGESQAKNATLDEVLRLNSNRDGWDRSQPMRSPRNYARAVVFRGAVYLVGGNPTVGMSHSSAGSTLVERYRGCAGG